MADGREVGRPEEPAVNGTQVARSRLDGRIRSDEEGMTGRLSVRRKDLHDQLGRSGRDGCRQGNGQDRLRLIGHVHRGRRDLRPTSVRKSSGNLPVKSDRNGLSRIGAGIGRFNSKRNGGDVVLPGTGEARHVERAPVAVIEVRVSSGSSAVA